MTNIRNALMQAAGTAASGDPVYVEDVFSNTLYVGNGNGTLNTVTTGLDLADKGGAVWIKGRDQGTGNHALYDSERGDASSNHSYKWLVPNENYEENNGSANLFQLHSLTSTGFKVQYSNTLNESGRNFVSWNFAKQEGFFDVVTWTGNATGSRAISHALNAKVGMILVKCTSHTQNWAVYHSGVPTGYGSLNSSSAFASGSGNGVFGDSSYNNIAPTTSVFYVGTDNEVNGSGRTYVAYVFAEGTDSGSQIFGDDGDEAIIKTGSFTPTGSGTAKQTINVGFEPQWLLLKNATSTQSGNWWIFDNMRGFTAGDGNGSAYLLADTDGTESAFGAGTLNITNQGFEMVNNAFVSSSQTFVYMAIRRGPMKEPSAGTDVLDIRTSTSSGSPAFLWNSLPFPPDWAGYRAPTDDGKAFPNSARLIQGKSLATRNTDAAQTSSNMMFDAQDSWFAWGSSGISGYYSYAWRRYPKVFDVVVYSGNGSPSIGVRNGLSHNLGVAPELIIHKGIDTTTEWQVGATPVAKGGYLNLTNSFPASFTPANEFTATTFDVDGWISENGNNVVGEEYVCFLFASLDGISKVGTYTGTGNDLNVTGLGAAARFVMIKRTDGTGDWFVFDSAMGGIVDGNDQYFRMNVGAAPVTGTDYIDPHSSGFTITSSAPAALNASGGTYLYLAFA